MNDIVYISVNNWFCGRDYPPTENFKTWLRDDLNQKFRSDKWAKENKLCIYYGMIDMSQNYTISAPREWVEKNCPELLTDEEYTYYSIIQKPKKKLFGGYEYVEERIEHKKKYSDFVYYPDEGETTPDYDKFDMPFREYCEKNFGSEYYETHYWDDDDEDEEESEEENNDYDGE
jgi:hypothetical protein